MKNHTNQQHVQIIGFVLPTEFNRNGKVMEIAIETEDFQQYIVSQNHLGKELFDFILAKVTVIGVISGEDIDGNPIINIESYELMNESTVTKF